MQEAISNPKSKIVEVNSQSSSSPCSSGITEEEEASHNGLDQEAISTTSSFNAFLWQTKTLLGSIYQALNSLGDLRALRGELTRKINLKQGYGKLTNGKVDLWIQRVDTELATGDQLEKEYERHVDSLCLAGICSTHYFSTSVFGGRVEKCVKQLSSLQSKGDGFADEELVVDAAELDLGAKMPCDSVGLEAKLAEVLTYLNQENVGIVGVHGQGGVGKTTLLKEINNHYVTTSENFLVVWIDVSKCVNLEAIQQAIGEKIGFPDKFNVGNIEVKASYICNALQHKKIILLLDNIREATNPSETIKLSEIGIPPSDSLNGSKAIFTTRPERVCRQMEPRPGRITSVKTLGAQQAWQLFVKTVGEDTINNHHPKIPQLARRVVQKCDGLPLALTLIGKAMCWQKDHKEWERTIKTLERPPLSLNDEAMTKLFSTLRYSYDSLPNETYKSCFMYCALFPEADLISKRYMIACWTFGDFSIDCDEDDLDPYYEAHRIMNVLVSSCLLEDEKGYVKMHDVVRSMALWIAKEDTLVISGMKLDEAPSLAEWKRMKRVSLMENDIEELTQVPECPHLLTLFLNNNRQLNEICSGFFESMGMLTVLDLSRSGIKELPESISRLVSLKFLDLCYTKIIELPAALIKLKALVYLDLTGIGSLRFRRKRQIFHHLSSLQFLGMMCKHYYYYYYEEDEEEVVGEAEGEDDEILLEELQVLENLKVLEISLTSFSGIMKLFNNRRLLKRTRTLNVQNFTSLDPIDLSLLAQSKHLNEFCIRKCDFMELKISQESIRTSSVLTQMICLNSITALGVGGCKYLEDITCVVLMPNLRGLVVNTCRKLREIISREKLGEVGEEVHPIFSSLATLNLVNLPVLKSIYSSNTLPLRFMCDLTVKDCPELKELPLDHNNGVLGCSQIKLEAKQEWWDALEWEDDAAKAALLPRFNLNHLS